MRALKLLLPLLLAGCGTPSELREDRVRTDYVLSLAPRQAARCVARNAERLEGSFKAQIRETETLVTEVHIGKVDVLAVAHVAPLRNGSAVTIWRNPALDARLVDAMAEGC